MYFVQKGKVLNMKRVFVASSQEDMACLPKALEDRGFEVCLSVSTTQALAECLGCAPDLAIVDAVQPTNSGLFLCAQIRSHTKELPVLFIQPLGRQVRMTDAVTIGASDCIARAAGPQGVAERAKQMLGKIEIPGTLSAHGVVFDIERRELRDANGAIGLTPTEARLIMALLEGKNRIVSREELMDAIWKNDVFRSSDMLTVNINHLRIKLRKLGYPDFILTQKRAGYMVHD